MEKKRVYLYWALVMGLALLSVGLGQVAIFMIVILTSSLYGLYKFWPDLKKIDFLTALLIFALVSLSNLFMGLASATTYLVAQALLRQTPFEDGLVRPYSQKEIFWTVLLTFLGGGALAYLNLINFSPDFSTANWSLGNLIQALRPGISEEIIFRYYFFALFVHYTKGQPLH